MQANLKRFFGFVGLPYLLYSHWSFTYSGHPGEGYMEVFFWLSISMVAAVTFLSYTSRWVYQNLSVLGLLSAMVLALYFGGHLFVGGMQSLHIIEAYLITFILMFLFPTLWMNIVWASTCVLVFIISAYPVDDPAIPFANHAINQLLVTLIALGVQTYLIRLAEARAQSEALFESLFEKSADALVYGDFNRGTVDRVNTHTTKLFETDDPEYAALAIQENFIAAHGAEEAVARIQAGLAKGEFEEDLEFTTRKGNRFFGRLNMRPMGQNNNGVLVRVADISDLHHRQIKAEKDRDLAEAMFEYSADALIYSDIETSELQMANRRAQELLETDDIKVMSVIVKNALVDAFPGVERAEVKRMVLKDPSWEANTTIKTASGRTFYGNIAVRSLKSTSSNTSLMRVSDLTQLHEEQQQLQAGKEAAEEAIEIRSRFLANMSHEIRTPMNGVIGMTSLLLNTNLSQEQRSYVETVRSSGESLLHIINEILDFSKIEAGQIEIENQVFDIEQCLADALDVVAPLAAQKHLEVVLDLPPQDRGTIRGDLQRIRQVLVNLLSNAIKFTEEGEVVLKVRRQCEPQDETNCLVTFEVIDTGIGIPANKIGSLFDAFTQADISTTRRFGGTGLGLSISKSLIELMGGEIQVSSRLREGSTFSFSLPVELINPAEMVDLDALEGTLVYAVDDNATNREVLSGLLGWLNLEFRLFETAADTLSAIDEARPALLITDMAMPHMDGAQLVDLVSRLPGEHIPSILLTSLDQGDVDWQQFKAVLRKPVRPNELFYAIRGALVNNPDESKHTHNTDELSGIEFKDQTVLLAEDNVVNQMVARQMLAKLNISVDIASNGREAIELLSQRSYDLVFMDVQMPEVDGLEATRLIRLQDQEYQPYIIAMTANARPEDRADCLDAGMNDFVSKPVRLEDLAAALQRASQQQSQAQP